jgi:DNA-binding transcriptional LysR family regulator
MTLWQLQAFATVAKEGSFTKAGKVLHITQPSVSALIIDLQKELEIKLFEKLGVKAHLTEAGRRLFQLVESALAILDKIPEEMAQVKGLKKGRIRVGGAVLAAGSFLPLAVQEFKRNHPGMEVVLKIDRSELLEKMLLDGDLDVAITTSLLRSRRLVSEAFREEKVVIIASPTHPLTKKRFVPLRLLANEPLITHEKGTRIRDQVEKKFAENGIPFAPALQVDRERGGRDIIRMGVASGLGIGFISRCFVVGNLKAGRIKELNVPELKLTQTLHINVCKDRLDNPLVQIFSELLRQKYRVAL